MLCSMLGLLVALTSAWQPAHTAYKPARAAYNLLQRRDGGATVRAEPAETTYDLLADIERFKQEKAAADAAAGLPAAPPPAARRRAARRAAPGAAGDGLDAAPPAARRPPRTNSSPTRRASASADRRRGGVGEPGAGRHHVLGTVLGVNFVVIVGLFLGSFPASFALRARQRRDHHRGEGGLDPSSSALGMTQLGARPGRPSSARRPEDDGGFRAGARRTTIPGGRERPERGRRGELRRRRRRPWRRARAAAATRASPSSPAELGSAGPWAACARVDLGGAPTAS